MIHRWRKRRLARELHIAAQHAGCLEAVLEPLELRLLNDVYKNKLCAHLHELAKTIDPKVEW